MINLFEKTEKEECRIDYQKHDLYMTKEKCSPCELKYVCRFMNRSMNEVVYGTD